MCEAKEQARGGQQFDGEWRRTLLEPLSLEGREGQPLFEVSGQPLFEVLGQPLFEVSG